MINVIIPTLNAANTLQATLESFRGNDENFQVIISDGGSNDETIAIAMEYRCHIVEGKPGRGSQLARGGQMATGEWLLFLHADSRLPADWQSLMESFTAEQTNKERAAVFNLHFDDEHPQVRRIERLVHWRTHQLGLPYGDQGLIIHRDFYNQLDGFRDMEIMEDVDMIRRIGHSRLTVLNGAITTSADRYRRDGYWWRPIKNISLMCLYWLGISPSRLAKLYP